jgi:hypothetical protein
MNTNLNSPSMATVVETFFIEETLSLIHNNDHLTKWNDLVAFLQLTGQSTLTKSEKSPIPFLWMNKALIKTFETLCPTKTNAEDYNKMPIPLDILDLIALSKREGYFDFIKIWYDEKTPDPICVGYRIPDAYKDKETWYKEYYSEKYLLGKWSDVKATFQQLVERAKERFLQTRTLELKRQIKQYTRELEDLQDQADNEFVFVSNAKVIGDISINDLPF